MDMIDWFVWMLFGHMFGDYLFQNQWMAIYKKERTWRGWCACYAHCTLYTCIICLFVVLGAHHQLTVLQIGILFLSHWVLDRYTIVEWWMRVYGIRSWNTARQGQCNTISIDFTKIATYNIVASTAFGAFVYIVCDNTLHLFMMFLTLLYL